MKKALIVLGAVLAISALSACGSARTPLEGPRAKNTYYNTFFASKQDRAATNFANTVNDNYLKTSGDSAGIASYGQVCDLLVNWHIQEIVLPSIAVEEELFDPYDESQVDLSGITNAR